MFEYTHKNHYKFKYTRTPQFDYLRFFYSRHFYHSDFFTDKDGLVKKITLDDEQYFPTPTKDNDWFEPRSEKSQHVNVTYGSIEYYPKKAYLEGIRAAKLISKKTNKIPNLFLSGGKDSELMARFFLYAEVPFKVTIIKFSNNENWHDIYYAYKFCQENNIKYNEFTIDLHFFLNHIYPSQSRKTECLCYWQTLNLYALENVEGLPIFGMGTVTLWKKLPYLYMSDWNNEDYNDYIWNYIETETEISTTRFCILNDIEAIPQFWHYTPELMYAMMDFPIVQKLTNNEIYGKTNEKSIKNEWYRQIDENLESRPVYNGLEKFDLNDAYLHEEKVEKQIFDDFCYYELKIPINILFEMLLGKAKN